MLLNGVAATAANEEGLAAFQAGVPMLQVRDLRTNILKPASELFARGNKAPAVGDAQKVIDDLHRKIGQLQVERDFLAGQPAISRLLRGGR
jgi:hypothetical protein